MHSYIFIFENGSTATITADTLPMAYDKLLNLKEYRAPALKVVYCVS